MGAKSFVSLIYPKMAISTPPIVYFGRQFADKKNISRQAKIQGRDNCPPAVLPRHDVIEC